MQKIVLGLILLVSSIVAYDISIKVKNIDSGGKLYIGLYNEKKDFKDILKTYKNSIVDINSSTLKVIFKMSQRVFMQYLYFMIKMVMES